MSDTTPEPRRCQTCGHVEGAHCGICLACDCPRWKPAPDLRDYPTMYPGETFEVAPAPNFLSADELAAVVAAAGLAEVCVPFDWRKYASDLNDVANLLESNEMKTRIEDDPAQFWRHARENIGAGLILAALLAFAGIGAVQVVSWVMP